MPTEKMLVTWDDDASFTQSNKNPGDYSALTRGDDNQLAQVTIRPIDSDDDDGGEDESENGSGAGRALLVAGGVVVSVLGAVGGIKLYNYIKKRRQSRAGTAIETTSASEPSADVPEVLEHDRVRMTPREAEQRIIQAIVARAYSDMQFRMVLGAEIVEVDDEVGPIAIDQFNPEEIEGRVVHALEENPALLDDLIRLYEADGQGDPLPQMRADHGSTEIFESPVVDPDAKG